jgi:hypothetical protein
MAEFLKAALEAVISVLWGRWFGKPKDPMTEMQDNAFQAKEQEAELLARGVPSDAEFDRIVREHQPRD